MEAASKAAGEWVQRNPDLVRNEQEGLLKELRRAGRLFRACGRAAGRKMCAGVFGPSQAGKSYLISALARGPRNQLEAVFGGETHDFLSEINPEGGKESTGLVTRFTLAPDQDTPEGYPVRLAMLSETDLVKIIANTYYADCEHKEDPQSDIGATLARLRELAHQKTGPVDLDDLEDLREYLDNDFRAKPRVQELERVYWDEALELGPKLDLEGRVRLYALIWDEVEEFTALLRELLTALETLGHPETCFCAMDALIPRDKSIIDVATLGDVSANAAADLAIASANGIQTTLPRPVVAALTAELTIVMADKPAPYFEHTDLLDFPGYRSRYKLDDVRKELKKDGMLRELFLRGKVAFLFQRYCAQRELNSMLLCIGPSNQEVQDLPGVINAWVASTHGATPEDRQGKPVSLFFILTKFDMEFEDKKGAPSLEARWDNRLHASLLDFFGKQHDWPRQWTPSHGFDNIFLLRNPNFRFEAVMDFSGDSETGIRPQRHEYVERLKKAFMASPLVASHFREPERAWQEAMRLNDGGISYIRESLSQACDPEIKIRQLEQNVNACRDALVQRLKGFYRTDDRQELRRQKLALIVSLFKSLGKLEKQRQRLGLLLRSLTINDSRIYSLHASALRRFREMSAASAENAPENAAAQEIDFSALDLGALNPFEETGAASEEEQKNNIPEDESSAYAALIESKWVEELHKLADNPASQTYFMLAPELFSAFATELATGIERLRIRDRLASEFRKAAAYANTGKSGTARLQAAMAGRIINEYVDWLGYNPRTSTASQRTIQLPGGQTPIVFQEKKAAQGLPDIGEQRAQYTQKWFQDWLNALAGLILDNINFDGKQTFNAAENDTLGRILAKLARTA